MTARDSQLTAFGPAPRWASESACSDSICRGEFAVNEELVLSIVVKARNEEAKIENCLKSCQLALAELGECAEIILVDSLSEDATVAIAKSFPVRIVQIEFPEDCCPGAAVELGYRQAHGKYIYLLDGDMTLECGFLPNAIQWLETNHNYAGVGGILSDTLVVNFEDRRRMAMKPSATPGDVDRLAGGGLFRRSDIVPLGYLGHRDLRANEEAELGFRLLHAGRKLHRLPVASVKHTGHGIGTFALMKMHFKSGRFTASGNFLRIALGFGFFWQVLHLFRHPVSLIIFWGCVFISFLASAGSVIVLAALFGLLFVVALSVKKKSVHSALFSLLLWHYGILGILIGIWRKPRNPMGLIPNIILVDQVVGRGKTEIFTSN